MKGYKKHAEETAILVQDIQALDILASGIAQDSQENKDAISTLLRVLAAKATAISRNLTKEADELYPLMEKIRAASGAAK
jgi:hypothetical protein